MFSHNSSTLAELIADIRQRADIPRSQHITDDEIKGYIHEERKELFGILREHFGDNYILRSHEFDTVTGTEAYDLPFDFHKGFGLELQIESGTPGRWAKVLPFNWAERARFDWQAFAGYYYPPRGVNVRYCINDQFVHLKPTPGTSMHFKLSYIPMTPKLVTSVTVDFTNVAAGYYTDVNGKRYYFTDTVNGIEAPAGTIAVAIGSTALISANRWITAVNANDGKLNMLSVLTPVATLRFGIGYEADVVAIAATTGITVSEGNGSFCFKTLNIENEWIEYVKLGGVIKCKVKAEEQVAAEMSEKARVAERIETEASNRDAAGPLTVVDVQGGGGYGPFGGAGGVW